MKQIIQNARSGKLSQVDVPAPAVRPGHLLVQTTASLISAGTERMIVEFARKTLVGKAAARPDLVQKVVDKARRDGLAAAFRAVRARLDQPLPLGYSAAGCVIAVGTGLEGEFHVGQRIAIAGAGFANHAEFNLVPGSLAAPVPDDVPDEQAAFGTLAAIALHGVRNLRPTLGDIVAVIGAGLVGQLAVQLLALSGARIIVIDANPARLSLARQLGAEAVFDISEGGLVDAVLALTRHRGVDGILMAAATDSNEPLATAAAIARDRARISMVGKVGTEFPFAEFMKKELEIVVSRSYGPGRYDEDFESRGVKYPVGFVRWTETENLIECLRLMSPAQRRPLDVAALTSHRFDFAEADKAYALVVDGTTASLGVLLTYRAAAETRPDIAPKAIPVARPAIGHCTIGVIGAGVFARAVLLPILKDLRDVTLKTVVTSRGANAVQVRDAFGFARAAAEVEDILGDPQINAVLVATPHDSHADLVARALAAGKHVFVEKPLALSRAEIDRVAAARAASPAFFTVGFNRRFASLSRLARTRLDARPGPRVLSLRVNAGPPPRQGWMAASADGGGR
ncbi:MAG TPA: bi-domain-containing oxidoreductase, partial [Alphaproteobacteria bacterium]